MGTPDPTTPPETTPQPPPGAVLEAPPTTGSKNETVIKYRPWLEANPKQSIRVLEVAEKDPAASATAAAFNRLPGMHASYRTVPGDDGKPVQRVWVEYDPAKPKTTRASS